MLFANMGRINRSKYITFSILNFFIFMLVYLLASRMDTLSILIPIEYMVYFLVHIRLIVLRFHDLDKSGNYFFLLLVPLYNIYLVFVLLLKKGTDGPNSHGEDPLAMIELT